MSKVKQRSSEFIAPLNMNGLRGRMLYLPAPSKGGREILIVYGQHASLERWLGLAKQFNRFGAVTMPDLPGFGGMSNFYKLGRKPTLDNLADYLAAFIKLRHKRNRLTLVGVSYGFAVVTRLLQRFPDIAKKCDAVVSLGGFSHKQDLQLLPNRRRVLRGLTYLLSQPLASNLFRATILSPSTLYYHYVKRGHPRFSKLTSKAKELKLQEEIRLWRGNDLRTHMYALSNTLALDNSRTPVALPVWHVDTDDNRIFSSVAVEQHLRAIYSDFVGMSIKSSPQASIITEAAEPTPLLPVKLRRLLAGKI